MNLSYVGTDRTGGKKVGSSVFPCFLILAKKKGLEVK